MTIAIPYAIRVKDPCWARKWGGNHVVGNLWEGGAGTARAAREGGREADTGGEVARRWNAVSSWEASIASRGRTNWECTSRGRECWDIVTVLGEAH